MKKRFTPFFHFNAQQLWPAVKAGFCLFILALLHITVVAQAPVADVTVSGKITAPQGEPVTGVTVMVKNSTTATSTDADGNFKITVPSDAILVVSSIGYKGQEVSVSGRTQVMIALEAAPNTMNDVVVTGYTSQRKASITGAIATINVEDMRRTRIADVGQALQGQVAGVFVSANTGAPGDGIKLRIRGEGTLGNNEVLYVVDGVPTRDISFLNPYDVKSLSVLKDAAAGAQYGSRAAGGVVLIGTKNGQKGKTNVEFDIFQGFYSPTNLPKMLNTDQYLTVKDQAWHNTLGNAAGAVSPYAADRNRPGLANTDWLNELFTKGKSTQAHISASGGSDAVQYYLSAGYFGQDGIVVENNDKYERFTFRTNINANVTDRFKVGTNLQMGYAQQDKISSSGDAPGVIRHALLRSPVISVYKDPSDPTYKPNDPYTDLPFYTSNNPVDGWSKIYEFSSNPIAIVHFTDDKRKVYQTFGNLYGEYALLGDKSLKLRSSIGVDVAFQHNKAFGENYGDDDNNDPNEPYPGLGRKNKPNNLDENRNEITTFTFTNTASYNKLLNGVHSINAVVGHEYITSRTSGVGGSRQNFDNTTDPFRYLDYGGLLNIYNAGSATDWSLLSFFAQGTYGYNNKYFVTATMRADASSRFGPNNKWGYFPSVSGGWIASKEKFMQNVNWISNLKLRASWGKNGNQEIPNSAYQTIVTITGGTPNVTRYGNPDVKWETTTQTNVGIDMSILKNKVTFSADYFNKKTDDIMLTVGLPAFAVGVISPTYVNAGAVTNKGFEFGVNYTNNDHAFKYTVTGNIATLTNKVDKLQQYVKNLIDEQTHTKTEVGQPISSYYGLVFDGIYQNQAEVTKTLFSNANGTLPGDIKFKDLNGDGQITADDRSFIGSPIPKYTYGFAFSANYKNFDFSFLFQGVQDVDRYNDLKQILNYDTRPFNSMVSVLDAWNGEGTSNTTPRNTFNNNGGGNVSSVFVEDASYIRLKNVEIGYTFQSRRMGTKSIRVFASGQNLYTGTSYTGLDPESTSLIDRGTYPQSKAFIVGTKINL